MGSFMALGLWSVVFVGTGCRVLVVALVVVVVRQSWPFVGQLSWWQSFVGWLLLFGGQGCLQWWGLSDVAWGQCVGVVVVGS